MATNQLPPINSPMPSPYQAIWSSAHGNNPPPHWTGATPLDALLGGFLEDIPVLEPNPTPALAETALASLKKKAQSQSNSQTLLQDIHKYPALKLDKVRSNAFEKSNKYEGTPFPWIMPHALVGIEIEVENIKHPVNIQAYWTSKPDNSLRNNGAEFVSIPLATKQIQPALHHLYKELYRFNKPDFSNRTSVHIHLNCRDMTQDQIYTLFLLYCLFEKHFYKMAGVKRLNSIFCVPIYRSNVENKAVNVIYDLSANWQKYCGLNLLPLVNNNLNPGGYGTIEFRHLYGTEDVDKILVWINNILALRKAAMEIPKEELLSLIKDMNTTSSYKSLYAQVFPEDCRILEHKKDFEDCVSNLKRELFGNEYKNTIRTTSESKYWQIANKLGIRG